MSVWFDAGIYITVLSLTTFLSVLSHLGECQCITICHISVPSASLSCTSLEDRWKRFLAPFFQQICFKSSLWTYLKMTNNSSKCLPSPFNSKCRFASPEFTLHLACTPTWNQNHQILLVYQPLLEIHKMLLRYDKLQNVFSWGLASKSCEVNILFPFTNNHCLSGSKVNIQTTNAIG